MQFSEKLKFYRNEKAFTQDGLAAKIGVTLSTLNRWENGANFPRCQNIVSLANALDINAADFLDSDNKNETEIAEIKKASILQEKENNAYTRARQSYQEIVIAGEVRKDGSPKIKNSTDADGINAFKRQMQFVNDRDEALAYKYFSNVEAFNSDYEFMRDLFGKLSPIGREKVFRFIQKYLFMDDENLSDSFLNAITDEE